MAYKIYYKIFRKPRFLDVGGEGIFALTGIMDFISLNSKYIISLN
jgi:hypothetical protein